MGKAAVAPNDLTQAVGRFYMSRNLSNGLQALGFYWNLLQSFIKVFTQNFKEALEAVTTQGVSPLS